MDSLPTCGQDFHKKNTWTSFSLHQQRATYVATSSRSVLDQHVLGLGASFSLNCVSYCSHAYRTRSGDESLVLKELRGKMGLMGT